MMAETSAELADLTVLTAEDPRTESLDGILEEMAAGAKSKGGREGETFWRVPDRGEAIRFALLKMARPGDIVLCWFDYGDRTYPDQRYTDQYPGLSYDAAEYLARKGVVNIGTDCIALDNSLDPQFSTHMLCKKYGIVNTESLANLGQLINRRFTFFGLPLYLPGGTGSPIRAFAFLPHAA